MALKRTLAQKLLVMSKACRPTANSCRVSSALSMPTIPAKGDRDPRDDGMLRRFLRPIYQSVAPLPEMRSLPRGQGLLEKLWRMDVARDGIRMEGLSPPPAMAPEGKVTVEDARKILKAWQMAMVKSKLREIEKECISREEFLQICCDCGGSADQGREIAKVLDDSGTIIVFGGFVFLKPDQVLRLIQNLIPAPAAQPDDPRWKELEELEKEKATIDRRARSLVRRELWLGLGCLTVQTAAFMRLTFWELTWDVMEPICFFVTSFYFMAGYTFFLRTSKEPSFEGFFQTRFESKQRRLMKAKGFDLNRYSELLRAFHPERTSDVGDLR
ncbi:hypothetical protein NMG60_11026150 [Bertholletia excelsa]